MDAEEILAAAVQAGCKVLYPSHHLNLLEWRAENAAECIMALDLQGGTFRTVKSPDRDILLSLVDLSCCEDDDVYETSWDDLTDYCFKNSIVVEAAPSMGETSPWLCFWFDRNPYPGTLETCGLVNKLE